MKRLLMTTFTFLAAVQLTAQQEVHLSVNAGMGKIALDHSPIEDLTHTRVADFSAPTYSINAHYSYAFGNFSLETGLRFSELKGKHTEGLNITVIEPGGSSRVIEKNFVVQREMRYLTVPLVVNYTIDKLTFGGGAYFSYLLRGEHFVLDYTFDELVGFQSVGGKTSTVDFGLTAHVDYALSDRASLLFSTNYGLSDISDGNELGAQYFYSNFNPVQRDLKIRQLMVGLKFRLCNS